MELKLNSGDVITIPDDCKAVIKDKIITVEKEVQEFKDGDFCVYSRDKHCLRVYIHKSGSNNNLYPFSYAYTNIKYTILEYDGCCGIIESMPRLATEEEKQFLLDVLHANGKDWDADNKQIVDYKWEPKIGEIYYCISYSLDVVGDYWSDNHWDNLAYNSGNCFKTEDEAQKYADKFAKILKERKL